MAQTQALVAFRVLVDLADVQGLPVGETGFGAERDRRDGTGSEKAPVKAGKE
jgi:hypothetical protein